MEVWKGGFLVSTPHPDLVPAHLSVCRLQGTESPRRRHIQQRVSCTCFSAEPENRSAGALAVRSAPQCRGGDWHSCKKRVSWVPEPADHIFQQRQTDGCELPPFERRQHGCTPGEIRHQ